MASDDEKLYVNKKIKTEPGEEQRYQPEERLKKEKSKATGRLGLDTEKNYDFNFMTCTEELENFLGCGERTLRKMHNFSATEAGGLYTPGAVLEAVMEKLENTQLSAIKHCLTDRTLVEHYFTKNNGTVDNLDKLSPSTRTMLKRVLKKFFWLSFLVMEPLEVVDQLFSQLPPRQ